MKKVALPCLVASWFIVFAFATSAAAQSAASILKQYEGLRGKEREQKLSEGAKKEGKVVVYSFTAAD